jgi:VCBS repeat-containing protein
LVETNAVLTASGLVKVTDPDAGEDKLIVQVDTAGTYGKFNVAADGNWTYTTNTAVNQLKAGQVVTETFTLQSYDKSTTVPVVITITGTNDTPVLTLADVVALTAGTEDNAYTVTAAQLLSGYSDVEGATLTVSGAVTADHGTVVFNAADNTYTITPAANYNGVVTLSYNVTDNEATGAGVTAATRVFSLTAVNDAALITGDTTKSVPETDAALTVTGSLSATDVDTPAGTTFAVQNDVAGSNGYG